MAKVPEHFIELKAKAKELFNQGKIKDSFTVLNEEMLEKARESNDEISIIFSLIGMYI